MALSITDYDSSSAASGVLVPAQKKTVAKRKTGGKKVSPQAAARNLQLKLKAKAAAARKKDAANFKKEKAKHQAKAKKAREDAKKKAKKEREAEKKRRAQKRAQEKKHITKMRAAEKKQRETEKAAQAKLRVAQLQAKIQAKYWREVEKQAHSAAEKRKAAADQRKFKSMNQNQRMRMLTNPGSPLSLSNSAFNHAVPQSMKNEIQMLRQQVAALHDANMMKAFGRGSKKNNALALMSY